ncbi:MAG: hypothetical protein Q8K43_03850 [Sulfurimicrobium sp.]|jgi:cell volume regulation protein A|nr:hypothetical protein [Sulfurimicrobium sp.]MDP2963696.1 hypothetical protein [Sulfurimicrobium sp.]MDZ7657385.1 hypothetical protein [Sulfurimicrobium sp.]
MTESAFNDAMGAIVAFTVLGVAMDAGDALLGLLKQSVLGILIGGFLAECAPVASGGTNT